MGLSYRCILFRLAVQPHCEKRQVFSLIAYGLLL